MSTASDGSRPSRPDPATVTGPGACARPNKNRRSHRRRKVCHAASRAIVLRNRNSRATVVQPVCRVKTKASLHVRPHPPARLFRLHVRPAEPPWNRNSGVRPVGRLISMRWHRSRPIANVGPPERVGHASSTGGAASSGWFAQRPISPMEKDPGSGVYLCVQRQRALTEGNRPGNRGAATFSSVGGTRRIEEIEVIAVEHPRGLLRRFRRMDGVGVRGLNQVRARPA